MASRFTALPLSSGESFILETEHAAKRWVILVDGGQSKSEGPKKNGLYKAIRKHCPEITNTIDIVICTHRDHDHAGGLPTFIKTWLAEGNDIGEFWLPGGWAGAVEIALTNPDRLVSMLHEGARAATYRIDEHERSCESKIDPMTRETFRADKPRFIQSRLYDLCIEDSLRKSDEVKSIPDQDQEDYSAADSSRTARAAKSWGFNEEDWEAIRSDLETSEIHAAPLAERAWSYERQTSEVVFFERIEDYLSGRAYLIAKETFHEKPSDSRPSRGLFRNAIDTAEAIRNIASAAAMFDIPVRWFDFAAFQNGAKPSGGIRGFLQPLNAIELGKAEREDNALALFFKLALTEQNVASLVFQRLETDSEPCTIFLGDSRLAFGIERPEGDFDKHIVQPKRPIVYTAAHHGSRNNDHAYEVLADWLPNVFDDSIAVRNGGVWNQTLSGYLKVKNRRCAQCHQCHGGDWSQLVQINSDGAVWDWPSDQGGKCGIPKRMR